jgi:hypothetical protein
MDVQKINSFAIKTLDTSELHYFTLPQKQNFGHKQGPVARKNIHLVWWLMGKQPPVRVHQANNEGINK